MPCLSRHRPRVFLLAAPMAWGKDAILLGLKDYYGCDVAGHYETATPGRTVVKKGSKNFGRSIVSRRKPRYLFRGGRLLLLGKGDDPGNGLPDALVVAFRDAMDEGYDVLAQCRLLGAAFTRTADALLRRDVGVENVAWLYAAWPVPEEVLVARMSGRGGRPPDEVREIVRASLGKWRAAVSLIEGQVGDGALGLRLPTTNRLGQVSAARRHLVRSGSLPDVPEGKFRPIAGG